MQDGKPRPPSVVLSALLDTLTPLLATHEKDTSMTRVIEHPLVLFHPDVFTGKHAGLFTYSQQAYACAQAIEEGSSSPSGTTNTEIKLPGPDSDDPVSLSQLVGFFRLPAAAFAKQRLGLSLKRYLAPVDDEDPVDLGPLQTAQFGRQLTHGDLPLNAAASLRATGIVPQGTPGDLALQHLQRQAQAIQATAEQARNEHPRQTLELDITIGPYRLMGALADVSDGCRVVSDFKRMPRDKTGAHVRLQFWIEHLTLCATLQDPQRCTSTLIGRDKTDGVALLHYPFIADAAEHLQVLLELYVQGQQQPLALFPDASLVAARLLRETADTYKALQKAKAVFAQSKPVPGDAHDPQVRYLYEDNPIELQPAQFLELAQVVFGPILDSEAL